MEFSKGNILLSLKSDMISYFSYFLLDTSATLSTGQKVTTKRSVS